MAPARRRAWQNTGEEGVLVEHAGRPAQREAHEYHAGSDSDAEGGDLVFNMEVFSGNIDAELTMNTPKSRKLGQEEMQAQHVAPTDSRQLRAFSERPRYQQQQPTQPHRGIPSLQRAANPHLAQLAVSLAATAQAAGCSNAGGLLPSAAGLDPQAAAWLPGPNSSTPAIKYSVSNPRVHLSAAASAAHTAPQADGVTSTVQRVQLPQAAGSGAVPHPAATVAATIAAAAPPPIIGRKKRRLQQQQQQQQRDSAGEPAPLSALHHELVHFAAAAAPTQADQGHVAQALERIGDVARCIWPASRAVLFGSQATGLALPGADLDIVVLGASEELRRAGTGFSKRQRDTLAGMLEELLEYLASGGLLAGRARIIQAKVPIIKCTLNIGGGLAADISLGTANGARAVFYVCSQLQALPPLRPLVLAVKAFLRERGLNEVYSGGLSSYSVVNMLVAHLQREGHAAAHAAALAHAAAAALPEERALAGNLAALLSHTGGGEAAGGKEAADLGLLLRGFFDLFGKLFQYGSQAVSVRLGGIVAKKKAWKQPQRPWLLAVEDPQEAGKDIGSGSFNMCNTRAAFVRAAEALADAGGLPWLQAGHTWANIQAEGQCQSVAAEVAGARESGRFPVLGRVIDVHAAIGRDEESRRLRAAQLSGRVAHAGSKRKAPEPGAGSSRAKRVKAKRQRKLMDRAQSQQQRRGNGGAPRAGEQGLGTKGDAERVSWQRLGGRPVQVWRQKGGAKAAQASEARQSGGGGLGSRKWGPDGAKRTEGGMRKGGKKAGDSIKARKPKRQGGWSTE